MQDLKQKGLDMETITHTVLGAGLFAYFEMHTGISTTDPNRTFSMPDGERVKTVEDVENWIIRIGNEIKKMRTEATAARTNNAG